MQGMTLENIAMACHGTYVGPEDAKQKEASMITTDSRQIEKDCVFVAIKGARVDGNDFVMPSYEGGALCCISEKEPENAERPYIVVESCYQALKDMAELYRNSLQTTIIGITGSVGKTTTKEMIASVLSEHFCTIKTKGNFNNEVGVPLTLFRIRKEHKVAIVEMGISEFGEMTRLSKMVRPDNCVITNIGQCHLENLHDRDGVLQAKTEIFTSMNPEGTIYLNGDDDKLITVRESQNRKIRFYGIDNQKGIYAKEIQNLGLKGTRATVVTPDKEFTITVPVPGQHMVLNALAAVAIALDLGMTEEEICAGIAKFKPVGGHSSLIETKTMTVLDDCYNANPVSMKAGFDVLSNALGRKIAIVGDMFELGKNEESLHYETGKYAAQSGIDLLVCVGTLAKHIYDGAVHTIAKQNADAKEEKQMKVCYYATKEEAVSALPEMLEQGDTVLVKASHGMHFEKIVAVLKEM
ncbi:MAG: UDP-N-acetylmuramoyl-tripeptide--D-alanyl-D-alanine ligase [bacterium]|nr:UDP-N-acetylmuramoyl-tripeptide--D-alanyl-D-alanine ligase [bacterium]